MALGAIQRAPYTRDSRVVVGVEPGPAPSGYPLTHPDRDWHAIPVRAGIGDLRDEADCAGGRHD